MTAMHGDARSRCPLCAGLLAVLPVPAKARSILSDGRVIATPLEKASCTQCGLACNVRSIDPSTVKSVYGEDYSLSAASPAADQARAAGYAAYLDSISARPNRVLEIGCGSGNLLKSLEALWPTTAFFGIDPALPANVFGSQRTTYWRSFFDDLPKLVDDESFDLIVSINVIEHVTSPQDFFSLASTLLSPSGQLIIVCPASQPSNLELLFQDHLHTFTFRALAIAAKACGLAATKLDACPQKLGDFQLAVFSRAAGAENMPDPNASGDATVLMDARQSYLNAWSRIDGMLLERIGNASNIAIFGAGQMAALLRCYAPRAWEKVKLLLTDNVDDAWDLGKPVAQYSLRKFQMVGQPVVIATAPESQAKVAARLAGDGIAAIRFDDVVAH